MIKPLLKPTKIKSVTEGTLWSNFSKFIRARDADERGYCKCISCSTIKQWNDGMQAGHFVSQGSDHAVKYNEINNNAQCVSCNMYKSGNLVAYRPRLINKYSKEIVEKLELSHEFKTTKKKLTELEIKELNKYYLKKFNEIKKTKCL